MSIDNLFAGGSTLNTNPLHWDWPNVPRTFTLHDKYKDGAAKVSSGESIPADEDTLASWTVVLGEPTWTVSVQGVKRKFNFLSGELGIFQQKLVLLTQVQAAPSSFYKFASTLLRHWKVYVEMLQTDPADIKLFWDAKILTIDLAKAGKSILKLAAKHSLGPWDVSHRNLVKGLSTRANGTVAAQKDKLAKRSKLIEPASQADIVRLLDEKGGADDLLEWQIEGLAALALGFQHGIRPVQILTLMTNHVQLLDESEGQVACIISFHEAKKKNTGEIKEISRQLKSEWAPLIFKLLDAAAAAGRTRLFETTESEKLWRYTKKVGKQFGVAIKYNYYKLRHTGGQTLADAGHGHHDISNYLGQSHPNSATPYIRSSRKQAHFINKALGTSPLYSTLESIATGKYVTKEELEAAHEDKQIAGIVGNRLIAGIGLCANGQGACVYDPVMSCYNCKKYMPVLDPNVHREAIAGMREQVIVFIKAGGNKENPAYLQLNTAIAGAQKALVISQQNATPA